MCEGVPSYKGGCARDLDCGIRIFPCFESLCDLLWNHQLVNSFEIITWLPFLPFSLELCFMFILFCYAGFHPVMVFTSFGFLFLLPCLRDQEQRDILSRRQNPASIFFDCFLYCQQKNGQCGQVWPFLRYFTFFQNFQIGNIGFN